MTMITTMPKTAARPPKPERGGRRYTVLPDPPRKKTDMLHNQIKTDVQTALRNRYANDPTALVGGEGYLVLTPEDLNGHAVPDCVVSFGVEADAVIREGNGYVVSEVGKPPDVIIEIASKSTGRRDYTEKRRIYRDIGSPEYWRFDHTGGQYHDAPLAGDILVDGEYRPIQIDERPDGTLWGYSPKLDLYFVWDKGDLRLYDPKTGEFLLITPEYSRELDKMSRERDEEREARIRSDRRAVRADQEVAAERDARIASDRRAEAERAARTESDRRAAEAEASKAESDSRAAEAEAEVARLRRLLGDLE